MPTPINCDDLHGHVPGSGCPHPDCSTFTGWNRNHCYSCGGVIDERVAVLIGQMEHAAAPEYTRLEVELEALETVLQGGDESRNHRWCFEVRPGESVA